MKAVTDTNQGKYKQNYEIQRELLHKYPHVHGTSCIVKSALAERWGRSGRAEARHNRRRVDPTTVAGTGEPSSAPGARDKADRLGVKA